MTINIANMSFCIYSG